MNLSKYLANTDKELLKTCCAHHLEEIASFIHVVGHHNAGTRERLGRRRNGPNRREGNDLENCPSNALFHNPLLG